MLVWHASTRDLDVESYTKAINIVFFQHRLIFCQVLIISPVSSVFSVNGALDREVTEYMANHRFLLSLASSQQHVKQAEQIPYTYGHLYLRYWYNIYKPHTTSYSINWPNGKRSQWIAAHACSSPQDLKTHLHGKEAHSLQLSFLELSEQAIYQPCHHRFINDKACLRSCKQHYTMYED